MEWLGPPGNEMGREGEGMEGMKIVLGKGHLQYVGSADLRKTTQGQESSPGPTLNLPVVQEALQ